MNKELEQRLKELFEEFRHDLDEVERLFSKGCITYEEQLRKNLDNQQKTASQMFAAIHQLSDW